MSDVYDIIVIGGGPCGIATVVEARANGLKKVLLLEKGDNHSQTIRKFYKEKGTPKVLTEPQECLFSLLLFNIHSMT